MTDGPTRPRRLAPRRDFLLIPLLILLTVATLLGGSEIGARFLLPQQDRDSCIVADPVLVNRARPMCVSHTKSAEGEWVENSYNDCGYRSSTPCGPPPEGGARLVVIGSSTSWGFHVPYAETWYSRTAKMLASRCQQPIDVQNLAGLYKMPQVAARLPEVARLHPAAIVMVVSPFDLEEMAKGDFAPAAAQPQAGASARLTLGRWIKAFQDNLRSLRAVLLIEHYVFRQPGTYIPLFLHYGDKADYLRPPFSPAWRQRLAYTDQALDYISRRLGAVDVPFVLVFSPQEVQADIVASRRPTAGVDPHALGQAIGEIARRRHIIYVDITSRFTGLDAWEYYLNVDGHLNGRGNGMLADALEQTLVTSTDLGRCAASGMKGS